MKKIKFLSAILCGLCVSALILATGCTSITTTTTASFVKQPDGSYQTNLTTKVTAKHQDPLKDKVVRMDTKEKGLVLKTFPSPAGTSGGFSPITLIFGTAETIWTTLPVYPGVSDGYFPPYSVASSDAGSLWNDSQTDNEASAPGLNPSGAYYQSAVQTASPLTTLTGTVQPQIQTIFTNAPVKAAVTTTNAP